MSKLDDIVNYRTTESYDYNMGLLPDEDGYNAGKMEANFTAESEKEAQKQQIKNLMLELIGKADRDYSDDNADEQSLKILVATSTACNELRAELRQKVNDL